MNPFQAASVFFLSLSRLEGASL